MKRNRNVDYLRAMAILIIITYHCYVLCGNPWAEHIRMNALISFGGEFGVTLFFVLSGFGIFWSLYLKEQNDSMPSWRLFMKQRCRRIMPQYYACICFLLIFQSAGMIGKDGVKHIITYTTFTQNLFISTHGSINGALWAMATIFQFYLIAVFLYRLVRKNWMVAAVVSVMITVISKMLIYHFLIPGFGLEPTAYFVYGRQLVSALDNFVLGMAAARIVLKLEEKGKLEKTGVGICTTLLMLSLLIGVSYMFSMKGIYGDYARAYWAHSILAALFAGLVVSVSFLPQGNGWLTKRVSFIAGYQYGMYLWHMPVIGSLFGSPLFMSLLSQNFLLFALGVIGITTIIGYFTTIWITGKSK